MFRYHVLFSVLLFCQSSWAFINIESLRQDLNNGFYGSTGLSASGSSGNVDVFNLGADTQNIYKKNGHESIFILKYNYGEAKGLKNSNKGSFHLRYSQQLKLGFSWEIFGQAEFNEFQSLSLRTLGGGGLRFCLFEDQKNSLYFGAGSFYEDEEIKIDTDQANFRGNLYLSFRYHMNESLESVLVMYYQPSFKVVDDYRVQSNLGIEFEVLKALKWVNEFSYSRDSRPPVSIKQEDIGFKVGFNYEY